jgi:tRNA threonylcarbamoyladenosine biosynthesis protein TsaE
MTTICSKSADGTIALGEALGSRLGPGDVVALFGELGSGKTTLAKGIARGAGVGEEVFSPSFTLIHEHRGRAPFYHVDLYRLTGAEDVEQLGLEEYLYGQGIVVIEWADRARSLLPAERIDIALDFAGDDRRAIQISGTSERMQKIVGLVVSDAGACN